MKHLSYWASQHVWPARGLVVLFYLAVNVLGMFWAVVLLAHRLHPGQYFPVLPCCLTLCALFFYFRDDKQPRHRFFRKKLCNAAFGLATLLFVIYSTAEVLQPARSHAPAYASSRWRISTSGSSGEKQHGLARILNNLGKAYADLTPGKKALLITAAILITALSIAMWTFICLCLLCDGAAEALVYTLIFLGGTLGIFICVRIIQSILKGEPTNRRERLKAGGTRIFKFK